MFLWSGASLPVSHISSTLRPQPPAQACGSTVTRIQVALDVELQPRARMVGGPPPSPTRHHCEAQLGEIQLTTKKSITTAPGLSSPT